jgi:flagellar biosynthetic protein FliR
MSISTDPVALIAFLLALVRAVIWVVVSPPFSSLPTPAMAKVGIAAALAMLAVPTLEHGLLPLSTSALIGALVVQVVMGFALGMVTKTLFSAVEAAGGISDLFGGIVLPPSLDPLSQNQTPIIGTLYQAVAVALLFVTGGDLVLVHGFIESFSAVGMTMASLGTISHVLSSDLSTFFVAMLEMAAPVLMVLFAAQIVLGLLSKAAPQINVFLLGFPLQVFLVLLLAALAVKVLPSAVVNLLEKSVIDGARALGG